MKRKAIRTSEKRAKAIVREREAKIRQEAKEQARQDLTRHLYVRPDRYGDHQHVQLMEEPRQPFVVIASADRMPVVSLEEAYRNPRYQFRDFERLCFRAVRKAWSDGRNTTVHWWDWEPSR